MTVGIFTIVVPMSFRLGQDILFYAQFYLAAALILILDTRLRFDRLAGRMTGGRVETAVDHLIHGRHRSPPDGALGAATADTKAKVEDHAGIDSTVGDGC